MYAWSSCLDATFCEPLRSVGQTVCKKVALLHQSRLSYLFAHVGYFHFTKVLKSLHMAGIIDMREVANSILAQIAFRFFSRSSSNEEFTRTLVNTNVHGWTSFGLRLRVADCLWFFNTRDRMLRAFAINETWSYSFAHMCYFSFYPHTKIIAHGREMINTGYTLIWCKPEISDLEKWIY